VNRFALIPSICLFWGNESFKPVFYLVTYRQHYLTNFPKDTQPQPHAGILCFIHNDTFQILLPTKRKFLSIQFTISKSSILFIPRAICSISRASPTVIWPSGSGWLFESNGATSPWNNSSAVG